MMDMNTFYDEVAQSANTQSDTLESDSVSPRHVYRLQEINGTPFQTHWFLVRQCMMQVVEDHFGAMNGVPSYGKFSN
jgi:hypothetical protein